MKVTEDGFHIDKEAESGKKAGKVAKILNKAIKLMDPLVNFKSGMRTREGEREIRQRERRERKRNGRKRGVG